ncbi:hypothetical protein NLJ89_g10881 [Agrocybe chaxingu]|uniref:Uncharacterized protein n=1 Tax=Agrocybe chaxingu TaxID=84603 RepID=A0A9W8JQE3_9AGAR|nr:hypothetical protein NLJ89_g10881 [Agrocybe chaxingu]
MTPNSIPLNWEILKLLSAKSARGRMSRPRYVTPPSIILIDRVASKSKLSSVPCFFFGAQCSELLVVPVPFESQEFPGPALNHIDTGQWVQIPNVSFTSVFCPSIMQYDLGQLTGRDIELILVYYPEPLLATRLDRDQFLVNRSLLSVTDGHCNLRGNFLVLGYTLSTDGERMSAPLFPEDLASIINILKRELPALSD